MNSINIEHLACNEFTRLVLQKPIRLVSDIVVNDRTPSFDGELIVYKDESLKKSAIEDFLKVQIKGVTKQKFNKKLSYEIVKIDLEVFKQYGKSVLYFVVAINPETLNKQAYYKSLTPLEINRLLNEIKYRGNAKGISVKFKKMNDGALYDIAYSLVINSRKQPRALIDVANRSIYSQFKLEFDSFSQDLQTYDIFEETAYIYGIDERTRQDVPIEAMIPAALAFEELYDVELGQFKQLKVKFEESKKFVEIIIEEIFNLKFDKMKKRGTIKVDEFNNLESYLKILHVLKYISVHEELPFKVTGMGMKLKIDNAKNLEDELNYYGTIKEIFNRIGIPSSYKFNHKGEIDKILRKIYDIFGEGKFDLIQKDFNPGEYLILNLELTSDIKILLYYDTEQGNYRNLFDKEIFNKLLACIPKEEGLDLSNPENSYRMSIFCGYEVNEIYRCINFNYDVYRDSFNIETHFPLSDINIQISLKLIHFYDNTGLQEYLTLAKELLLAIPDNDLDKIAQVNILQIKVRLNEEFQDKDYEFLEYLLENQNPVEKFCATVLLKQSGLAKRLYEKLDKEDKELLETWPIYTLFNKL